jgi:hypothetical protein
VPGSSMRTEGLGAAGTLLLLAWLRRRARRTRQASTLQ